MLTLNDGRSELWQWDTGRKLNVDADCSQVHFSNKVFGRSIDVDVIDGIAIVPDILLQTDKDLNVWAFVGTSENGYTKISKTFKVNRRNKPADYVFTPPDQTSLEELNERIDELEEKQEPAIKNAVEDYLEQNPVEVPVQSVNGQTGAVQLSAADVGARPENWMPTAHDVGALPSTYTPPNQTAEQVGADPKGTADAAVGAHNTDPGSHNDIRLELQAVNARLTAFFDSDDQTLDELSEIVAYITRNKTLIDAITTSKVSVSDIVDNLTTNLANRPLSAAKGVVLKGLVDALDKDKLDASALADAINEALAQAKASGEFDGPQGPKGDPGETGAAGSAGKDGISPVVTVTAIDGGHRVTITDKNGAKTFDVMDGEDGEGGGDIDVDLVTPITYAELKALRDSAGLAEGCLYRITDYVTTSTQANTQSAGHPFDIIVRALGTDTLDEEAKAIQHEGDEYFANSNLGGWQLWYTLDNDTSRFAWADEANGKGVVYRMIDENGNDCPYDFKNIQMRNPLDATDEKYYYTFDDDGIDHSLNGNLCFNNVIKKYIVTAQEINNIIFIDIKGYDVSSNSFDVQCYSNVFYRAQRNNRFGRECYENLFLGYNFVNSFDTKFRKNTVGTESQSMQFGQGATSNVIGANTYYCRFGNYFRYNTTCQHMYYSEFGHYVQNCILGESADAVGRYMRFLTFENNVQYVNLYKTDTATETYMENIKICSGTVGKSASRIMIEVSELAQKYAITYANNSNGELVKYCDADGGNIDTDAIVQDVIAKLPVYNGEVETV